MARAAKKVMRMSRRKKNSTKMAKSPPQRAEPLRPSTASRMVSFWLKKTLKLTSARRGSSRRVSMTSSRRLQTAMVFSSDSRLMSMPTEARPLMRHTESR